MGDCGSSPAGKGRPALPDQPEERGGPATHAKQNEVIYHGEPLPEKRCMVYIINALNRKFVIRESLFVNRTPQTS